MISFCINPPSKLQLGFTHVPIISVLAGIHLFMGCHRSRGFLSVGIFELHTIVPVFPFCVICTVYVLNELHIRILIKLFAWFNLRVLLGGLVCLTRPAIICSVFAFNILGI